MFSLIHLRYFHDAALLGSVAAAAKKHRLSPSAISQAIKGLEAYFSIELLKHNRNRFELTDEGRALLDRSFPLFTAVEKLEEDVAWSKEAFAGTVTFATQQSIAHYVLPPFLAHLRAKYPAIRPKMRLATTEVVRLWLEQREVDFVLSVDNVAHDAYRSLPILEGHYVLGAAKGSKATDEGFLLPSGTKEAQIFRRDYEITFGRAPRILMEVDSWGVIKRLAEQGLGVGLFPDYLLRFEKTNGLRLIDLGLAPSAYSVNAYYCSKRNSLSKNARVFLDELEGYTRPT